MAVLEREVWEFGYVSSGRVFRNRYLDGRRGGELGIKRRFFYSRLRGSRIRLRYSYEGSGKIRGF